ncbi:MAG: hypothetical protein ACREIT_08620, partial [Tepidisphaeraceae bacterium]
CVLAYATTHYVEDVARRARLWSASQGLGTVKWWLPLSVAAPWLILYPPHPFDPALRAAAYLCGGPLLLGAVAVSLVALVQVIIGLRPPAWTS